MAKKSKVELRDKVDKILDKLLNAMDGYSSIECYDVLQALRDEIDNDTVYHKFKKRSR